MSNSFTIRGSIPSFAHANTSSFWARRALDVRQYILSRRMNKINFVARMKRTEKRCNFVVVVFDMRKQNQKFAHRKRKPKIVLVLRNSNAPGAKFFVPGRERYSQKTPSTTTTTNFDSFRSVMNTINFLERIKRAEKRCNFLSSCPTWESKTKNLLTRKENPKPCQCLEIPSLLEQSFLSQEEKDIQRKHFLQQQEQWTLIRFEVWWTK